MVRNAKPLDSQRDPARQQTEPGARCDPSFKPVALPALAAAVCRTPRPEPRKRGPEDIPPVLREDTTD